MPITKSQCFCCVHYSKDHEGQLTKVELNHKYWKSLGQIEMLKTSSQQVPIQVLGLGPPHSNVSQIETKNIKEQAGAELCQAQVKLGLLC